jgi:predicted P-loop ATPase
MAGFQRVEIEALKHIISANYITYRPMRTNDSIKVPQNCTFIGISNKSLTENVYDPTGLRRFVEFKCLDSLDWSAVNSVDSFQIWQSIDENKDRGYLEEFKSELQQHQEELAVPDEMQNFITVNHIAPVNETTREISALDLYNFYAVWRANNGYGHNKMIDIGWFCRRLRSYHLTAKTKVVDGKQRSLYYINPASEAFNSTLVPLASKVLEFKK